MWFHNIIQNYLLSKPAKPEYSYTYMKLVILYLFMSMLQSCTTQLHSYSNGVVQPERSSNVFTASVGCKGNEQTLSNCLTTPIAQHSLENQQINFVACRQGN